MADRLTDAYFGPYPDLKIIRHADHSKVKHLPTFAVVAYVTRRADGWTWGRGASRFHLREFAELAACRAVVRERVAGGDR